MKYSAKNLAKAFIKLAQENPENQREITKSLLSFCKIKKLQYILPSFLRYFEIEAKRESDTETLKIFSAAKLSEGIMDDIRKISGAKNGSPAELVEDKDIVAGFVAYYQNKIIDASLKNNLHILKNKITA